MWHIPFALNDDQHCREKGIYTHHATFLMCLQLFCFILYPRLHKGKLCYYYLSCDLPQGIGDCVTHSIQVAGELSSSGGPRPSLSIDLFFQFFFNYWNWNSPSIFIVWQLLKGKGQWCELIPSPLAPWFSVSSFFLRESWHVSSPPTTACGRHCTGSHDNMLVFDNFEGQATQTK